MDELNDVAHEKHSEHSSFALRAKYSNFTKSFKVATILVHSDRLDEFTSLRMSVAIIYYRMYADDVFRGVLACVHLSKNLFCPPPRLWH